MIKPSALLLLGFMLFIFSVPTYADHSGSSHNHQSRRSFKKWNKQRRAWMTRGIRNGFYSPFGAYGGIGSAGVGFTYATPYGTYSYNSYGNGSYYSSYSGYGGSYYSSYSSPSYNYSSSYYPGLYSSYSSSYPSYSSSYYPSYYGSTGSNLFSPYASGWSSAYGGGSGYYNYPSYYRYF